MRLFNRLWKQPLKDGNEKIASNQRRSDKQRSQKHSQLCNVDGLVLRTCDALSKMVPILTLANPASCKLRQMIYSEEFSEEGKMQNAVHCSLCGSFGVVGQVIGSGPCFKEICDNPNCLNNPDYTGHPSDEQDEDNGKPIRLGRR
jgi:hypothetical protein